MPTYDVRNTETGEEKEVIISYDALVAMTHDGTWEQVHKSASTLITHTDGILKTTSGDWRDLLKRVKKGSGRDNSIKTY
jgi:hypothetical protein